jgi:broad specificity phosphatase PhoE
MSRLNLYFVRHAQSEANVDKRNLIGGKNIAVPITREGYKQAILLGDYFRRNNITCDVAFSSHAKRTKETAEVVLVINGYTGWLTIEEELIEHDSGDWDGLSRDVYNRPDVKEELAEDYWNFEPGDSVKGESENEIADRMIKFILKTLKHYSQYPCISNIFIFSHAFAIKFMLAKWCGLHLPDAHKITIDNTGVTVLRFKNGIWINPLVPYEGQENDNVLTDKKQRLVHSTDLWNSTEHLE